MQRIFYLAALLLLLVGCTSPTTPVTAPVSVTEGDNTFVVADTLADDTETAVTADLDENQPETPEREVSAAPILVPTDVPQPTLTEIVQEETDWLTTVTLEDNLYILGNPNAPIRLVDYSDFL